MILGKKNFGELGKRKQCSKSIIKNRELKLLDKYNWKHIKQYMYIFSKKKIEPAE